MTEMTPLRRWLLLATVSAGLLLITLDNTILFTALPTLTEQLGATGTQSLWVINAYPLVIAGLLLGAGTLGDRHGHRRMFLIGLVIFGVASLAAAFAPRVEVLIAARAVLAVGAAAMMPATLSLIRISFRDERERNLAIAIWGSVSIVGAAIGPIIGGLLLRFFWWGSVFLINVPIVVIAIIATALIAPRASTDASQHWDLISSIQIMCALTGAVMTLKELAHTPPNWLIVGVAAVVSALGFWFFIRRQRRLPQPLLDFTIFSNRAFSAGVLAAALAMFTLGGFQLATTQRFQLVAGFTPLEAGALVAAAAIGSLPTALVAGATLHRVGLLPLIAGGFVIGLAGMVLTTAAFGVGLGLGWFIAGLLVTGAGLGLALGVASTAIVGNVPARRAGMAASVEEVAYEFGNLVAVTIVGSLLTFVYSLTVALPAGAPVEAGRSLVEALTVTQDPAVHTAAQAAYDRAYLVVMIVVAAILGLAAAGTAWLLRDHGPGTASQLSEMDENGVDGAGADVVAEGEAVTQDDSGR